MILCERGVRTFDAATRNLFDLTAIPLVHKLSHLPIVADPSHGTGLRDKVTPMARALWRLAPMEFWWRFIRRQTRLCPTAPPVAVSGTVRGIGEGAQADRGRD